MKRVSHRNSPSEELVSEQGDSDSEEVIRDCTAKLSADPDNIDALMDRGRAFAKTNLFD